MERKKQFIPQDDIVTDMPFSYIIIKLHLVIIVIHFVNAINSLRKDLILDSVTAKTPELYCFTHAKYMCEPKLAYGEHIILSREGYQQGDHLSLKEFCDAVHSLLARLVAILCLSFMNVMQWLLICEIINASKEIGLQLNSGKCEIITDNFDTISHLAIFKNFKRVAKEDMALLGAAVLKGLVVEYAILKKVDELNKPLNDYTVAFSQCPGST